LSIAKAVLKTNTEVDTSFLQFQNQRLLAVLSFEFLFILTFCDHRVVISILFYIVLFSVSTPPTT